jgi:taurine---2-oxoglutarate transaminase
VTAAAHAAARAQAVADKCKRYTVYEWGDQNVDPLAIDSGKGPFVYGIDGTEYIDFNSVSVSVNIGHGDPRVAEAVAGQLAKIEFASPLWATEIRAEVAEKLAQITPRGLNKTFFTLAGADANEAAIRTARLVTGRRKILARRRAYHGGSGQILALAGDPRRWAVESYAGDIVRIPDPYYYQRLEWQQDEATFCSQVLAQTEEIIQLEGPHTIAAIFIETVTGSNGIIVPPDGWLRGLRALCTRYGILLICDEVMSGFGRTGAWFSVDHWGVEPDIMTSAKGLTSSYLPLGACFLSDEVAAAIQDVPFGSGLTYQSHPVGLAAAKANLQIYESDGLIANSAKQGEYLRGLLRELGGRHPSVGDVRGLGLFNAIELVYDRESRVELFPLNGPSLPEAGKFGAALRSAGLLAGLRGPWLMACPPLCVTSDVIDRAVAIIDSALSIADSVTSAAGAPPPPHLGAPHPAPWKT